MQTDRPRLFGTNGVRGVYGKELTNDLAIDLCYALATYFGKGPIVVGYDGRKSSPVLSRLVRATLSSAGLDTANAGLVPVPGPWQQHQLLQQRRRIKDEGRDRRPQEKMHRNHV